MKRLVLFLTPVLLAALLGASVAHSQPVDSGTGRGAGWSVGVPGIANVVLVPEAVASIPNPCPPSPASCEAHATNQLLNASVATTVARADALRSAADAYKVAGQAATLQTQIQAAHTTAATTAPTAPVLSLPTAWNTRGYARVESFSALNGAILADSIESETVSATRSTASGFVPVSGAGARVVNLRLAGTLLGQQLSEIVPGSVNQVLFNEGGIRIVLWETNWNPKTATTVDGQAPWVTALHITDTNSNVDMKIAESRSEATYVAPPPPVESPTPSGTPSQSPTPTESPSASPTPDESPSESPTPSETPSESPTPEESPSESPTPEQSPSESPSPATSPTPDQSPTPDPPPSTGGGNSPPVPEDDDATTPQGTPVDIAVATNDRDPDGNLDTGSVVITSHPGNGAVTCANGECTYTPAPGFTGTDSFVYRICDTDDACATATVTITVTPGGGGGGANPPVARDDSASTPRDTSVSIDVVNNDSDPDGDLDPSSVRVTRHPYRGAVTCSGGTCVYTPAAGFFGTDTFVYRICDLEGACTTATVTITVTPGGGEGDPDDNPPVARNDSATTSPGEPVTIVVVGNDGDPDGDLDPTSTAIVQHPENGAVTCSEDGTCTYTPAPGFTGTDSFTYQVCDDANACTTAVVTVTIGAPGGEGGGGGGGNNPPVARDDATTTPTDTPVLIGVTPNDDDPDDDLDPSTVKVIDDPEHGSVVCGEGVCTYTPDAGFAGSDSFTYEVCDTTGRCDQATVLLTIIGAVPTPDPDNDDEDSEGGGGDGGGDVAGNDPDEVDGDIDRPEDSDKPAPGSSGNESVPEEDGAPEGGPGSGDPAGGPDSSSSLFGAPAGPGLPLTGQAAPFYLAIALNLLTAGGLLLVFGARRRTVLVPLLASGEGLSLHEKPRYARLDAQRTKPEAKPNAVKEPIPKKTTAARPSAAPKRPAPKKAPVKKTTTATKKTAAPKKAAVKKTTVAKPGQKSATKAPVKARTGKKTTVARKKTAYSSKRKSTVRKTR